MNLAQKLVEYRKDKNLTQGQLAKKLGITQVHVSRIEQGSNPSPSLAIKISSLLGELIQRSAAEAKSFRDKNWSLSYFVLGGQRSGDRVLFYPKKFSDSIFLAHVDAEG